MVEKQWKMVEKVQPARPLPQPARPRATSFRTRATYRDFCASPWSSLLLLPPPCLFLPLEFFPFFFLTFQTSTYHSTAHRVARGRKRSRGVARAAEEFCFFDHFPPFFDHFSPFFTKKNCAKKQNFPRSRGDWPKWVRGRAGVDFAGSRVWTSRVWTSRVWTSRGRAGVDFYPAG